MTEQPQPQPQPQNESGRTMPGLVPRPDPTLLTTQQLLRELGLLRDELTREIGHIRDGAATRMNAMDAATTLQLDALQEVRPQTQRQIGHLKELLEEKFASVYRMFDERDVRTNQASEASKQALDAALAAAKELVNAQAIASGAAAEKAELSTIKQIDQIGLRIDALREAQDQRIVELKERIDRGEGTMIGQAGSRDQTRLNYGAILGSVSLFLVLVFGVISVVIAVSR